MVDEITDLFEYNLWANHRLLDACAPLTIDELNRDLGSSFPSVLATLRHVASAEWIWLQRWTSGSPAGPSDSDLTTLQSVRQYWAEVEEARARFIAELSEERLLADVTYRNLRGDAYTSPLWKLMRHVVNHATHHRGQVVTMLRQLGGAAPNTDLITYFREH